jgi:cell division protein FtsI/penicillin-binding protein 2
MAPWFVNRVTDAAGEVVYQAKPAVLARPITKDTAKKLRILMEDTVLYGTGRKTFRRLRRKKAFKGIALGAKTGTINDRMDQYKYDWISIFAIPGTGKKRLSMAVLAVHEEKLGIRAKDIGRLILQRYYRS